VNIRLFLLEHLNSCVNQESAKDVDDPVEPIEQCGADKDHCQANEQGSEDTPEENTVLIFRGYLEEGKDQDEDKKVINGQ